MLYMLMSKPGWSAILLLLIIIIVLYSKLSQQLRQLRDEMAQLKAELQQHKDSSKTWKSLQPNLKPETSLAPSITESISASKLTSSLSPPPLPNSNGTDISVDTSEAAISTQVISTQTLPEQKLSNSTMEPDEHSLPIVTSFLNSIRNWFFGGNLVVRVGVLVLLVGVVLLLRLLSEYIEVPIEFKLLALGIVGLAIAGLGLKLVAKRFAYGITLQGAGLAIAYLSTYFAYSVYQVIPSLPSFIMLGMLSAIIVGLAVRQNAFPLALLALSGGFFAPLLTSADTGSLSALFSYYLLLNVAIATIAHYRPWKVLNILGVAVTFGLAYYWGVTENLTTAIESQRWLLVLLVALHLILYLFVVIRYAQQIIAYNAGHEADANNAIASISQTTNANHTYLFPIDSGLLFSVPLLAFGLFAALLADIEHALTITSAILAVIYLGLGWSFTQRSQRYALITEGMLALGFGFLALVIPLALDAEWIAFGWSVQGLALVWFGRRSLRAWSVLFGILLQLISVSMLMITLTLSVKDYPTLALTISALSYLASLFILRASNSPIHQSRGVIQNSEPVETINNDDINKYATALGITNQAAQQWLASVNSQSTVFKVIWRSPVFIGFLTFTAIVWCIYVLIIDFDQWLASWKLTTTALIAMSTLVSLTLYWVIDRYRPWSEIRQFSHGLLLLFYLMLVLQLPQKYEFEYQWKIFYWPVFAVLLIGWLIIGQLWLKTWHAQHTLKNYDGSCWLGAGILVLAAAVHYGLPDSQGVITILIPVALMLIGLWLGYRSTQDKSDATQRPFYWFNPQQALLDNAKIFVPLTLLWTLLTNFSYDGVIWNLPYFPLINLYDITLWVIMLYGLGVYTIYQQQRNQNSTAIVPKNKANLLKNDWLLIILSGVSFWIISSMLVRTLHAFIGTPLWNNGAWNSEQVQTGLTILWTLLALVATIIASRYWQRTLWFMGIGLLGIVVLKLVLVDLSQTEAIWRVISFIGAGSLILLIGYLAPLPPTDSSQT